MIVSPSMHPDQPIRGWGPLASKRAQEAHSSEGEICHESGSGRCQRCAHRHRYLWGQPQGCAPHRAGQSGRARVTGPRTRRGQGCRACGVRPCGQHRTQGHVLVTGSRHQRRLRRKHARHERQPTVRLRTAGHRFGQSGDLAGRLRYRHRRRRRKHEPRALSKPEPTLGHTHGRCQAG